MERCQLCLQFGRAAGGVLRLLVPNLWTVCERCSVRVMNAAQKAAHEVADDIKRDADARILGKEAS